jgi:rhodanese-related sulfurtransferase
MVSTRLLPVRVFVAVAAVSILVACGGGQAEQLTDAQKKERLAALYQGYRSAFPSIDSITVEELLQLQLEERRVVLVDVREPEEMAVSMIPGAIDAETFRREAPSYREAIVVPYCTAGYRSGLFTQELQQAGWDVRNLEGSILAWTLAGLPLENAAGPTKEVHVFGRTWDLAAEDFATVW